MRRLNMLIVMTAMVFVAAGSSRGSTSPGQLRLDRAAGDGFRAVFLANDERAGGV